MSKSKQSVTPQSTPPEQVEVTTYAIYRDGDGFVLVEYKIKGTTVVSVSRLTEPDFLDITSAKLNQILRRG